MPRNRIGGIRLPEGDADVTFAVEVDGDDEEIVEAVAMAARDGGVRALQAFESGKHPDECAGVPVSIDWEAKLADDEDGEDAGGSDE